MPTLSPDVAAAPKLTVLIRCRNEAASLRNLFSALEAQKSNFLWEIVIVDNESTDDTRAICEQHGARVVSLPKAEFSYGRALNVGISQARGELVLFLSAHALPIGSYFMESAVAPFSDSQIAAVRCLFTGNSRQLQQWYAPKDIQYSSPEEQRRAESGTQWVAEYPTAGCCVIRRAVWEEVQYDEQLESNEDKLWASQVLAKGYKIRCCADAVWIYTRKYSKQEQWLRDNRQHLALYRINKYPPLTWPAYVRVVGRAILAAPLVAVRHIYEVVRWHTYLVTIPRQARRPPHTGSFPEFDRPAH